ncbi:MAG: KTSC domain-containing protein [Actinomycetota bacterium]|nr:KTSC domain-containing protein [Actinomycetota bacterium]
MRDRAVVGMRPVVSEAVARIGYDEEAQEVYVEFNSGRTYAYMDVPAPVWQDFETADSKGGFVNRVLKPNYAGREV